MINAFDAILAISGNPGKEEEKNEGEGGDETDTTDRASAMHSIIKYNAVVSFEVGSFTDKLT